MSGPVPTLELRNLSAARGGARVLDDISLTVRAGEIVAVIGPNGAGKTTLLEAVIGAVPLAAGEVSLGGRPLRGIADRARWLDYVSGEAEPAAEVRVETLLGEAREKASVDPAWSRALETRLGLQALRRCRAGALSRGERRRILLYQALALGRPFLLLDEPTGVFDPLQLLDIAVLFQDAAARGSGLLITVHQMSDAEAFAMRIVLLSRGRVIAAGTLNELRQQAAVAAVASLQEVFLALLSSSARRVEQPHASA